MEIVVIDMFVVPDESRGALLETSRAIQAVLKVVPGFVEGFVHVKKRAKPVTASSRPLSGGTRTPSRTHGRSFRRDFRCCATTLKRS